MLNIIVKNPVAVPPYQYPTEKSFTCEGIVVRLDPYEQEALCITEENGYVKIMHNDRVVAQIRIEEP